jgi:hypothetical protein
MMKDLRKYWRNLAIIVSLVFVFMGFCALTNSFAGMSGNPRILPIQSHPYGKTYNEWAAEWWQWALEIPFEVNPLFDLGDCTEGQEGRVWFLATTLAFNPGVERECTVPPGTAIFFPIINAFYGALPEDPPEQKTEEFLRAQVDCDVPSEIYVEIDGSPVSNPLQYYEESPLFDLLLPEGNLFGLPADFIVGPCVDSGYYIFLPPLPPGEHIIHWGATWSCPFGDFTEEVTYEITVSP